MKALLKKAKEPAKLIELPDDQHERMEQIQSSLTCPRTSRCCWKLFNLGKRRKNESIDQRTQKTRGTQGAPG